MAKQDDFVRITLRLPPELHARLAEQAGVGSLNAQIVERLEYSFTPPGNDVMLFAYQEGLREARDKAVETNKRLDEVLGRLNELEALRRAEDLPDVHGPATDAVASMDAAIKKDRKRK